MTADRRWGVLVMVLAAAVLLTVTGLGGRDVSGRAVGLPPVPVPESATCLRHSTDFDAVPVPCTEIHTAEVVRAWTARELPMVNGGQFRLLCPTGVESPAPNAPSADWIAVSPPITTTLLRGGGPVIGFVACVRMPVFQKLHNRPLRFVGRLASGPDATRTARIGFCLDADAQQVDCTAPHQTERLGQFVPTKDISRPTVDCGVFAPLRIGSQTPLSGAAALTVSTVLSEYSPLQTQILMGNGTEYLPARSVKVMGCDVHAPAGRSLTDSVVGLGIAPVPLR